MTEQNARLIEGLFYFVPMQKMTINSKSLIGFTDEIETAKKTGWKVTETRAEYFAELVRTDAPKLVFKIGPVSNRNMKD